MDEKNIDNKGDLIHQNIDNSKKENKPLLRSSFKDKIYKFENYLPQILEIHNDNVKNRILFILASILVYCFATFLIFNMDVKVIKH